MPVRTPPAVAKRLKSGRGSPRPAERRSEPPLHPAPKVLATTGKTEPPPSTNVAHVTEFTMDGDWVRRTPSALLILPPPPQFADTPRPTHRRPPQPSLRPSLPLLPARLPSRSNTAAPAMRPSRSHIAAPAARLARSHGKKTDETDGPTPPTYHMEDAVRTSYATIAATPTHQTSTVQTTPATNNTQAPAPSQQPMLPTLVVKRLPNWVGHFRTIAEALGHAPNARAHKKGVMFLPKTEEELRTVQRCLEEAAASDSAISFEIRKHNPSEEEETYPSNTSPAEPTATRQDVTPLPATAELRDDAPPKTIPAASVASDVTQAGTDTYVSAPPLTRRRRRKRAPRPTYSPVAAGPRRPPLLPTPTAGRAPTQARTPCYDRPTPVAAPRATHYSYQAPPSLDLTVRVILEALTTGIAAYLREQGAMPAMKHPSPYRALSQEWQARAGGIPAQRPSPGK